MHNSCRNAWRCRGLWWQTNGPILIFHFLYFNSSKWGHQPPLVRQLLCLKSFFVYLRLHFSFTNMNMKGHRLIKRLKIKSKNPACNAISIFFLFVCKACLCVSPPSTVVTWRSKPSEMYCLHLAVLSFMNESDGSTGGPLAPQPEKQLQFIGQSPRWVLSVHTRTCTQRHSHPQLWNDFHIQDSVSFVGKPKKTKNKMLWCFSSFKSSLILVWVFCCPSCKLTVLVINNKPLFMIKKHDGY